MGHSTTLLLVALALLSSFCPLAPCTSIAPLLANQAPCSNVTLPIHDSHRTLTLFKQSSLSFPPHDHPLSFTFTASYIHDAAHPPPPSLAFILVRSPSCVFLTDSPSCVAVQSMELRLEDSTCFSSLLVCNSTLPQPALLQIQRNCSLEHDSHEHDFLEPDEILFKDEVSLTYNADTAAVHVQTIDYSHGLNQRCDLSLQLPHSTDDSTVLFVGYITSGEATINVTVTSEGHSAKSNHFKVVVWVIVGLSMMGLLVGFLILVFFITKRRRRPSLVNSRPVGHGAPSRSPFYHHDLEYYGATPMMRALPPSPPYTDAFQISGTTTWLKQPSPR